MTTNLKNIINPTNKHENGFNQDTALTSVNKNKNVTLGNTKQTFTKKPPRRKRVLYFEDLDDTKLVQETKRYIKDIENEVENQDLVSLKKWCDNRNMNTAVMVDLLNDANLPIIRLGGFEGAYGVHLDRVFQKEIQRQLQQQIQNRVCARVLSERYHANKEDTKKKKKERVNK